MAAAVTALAFTGCYGISGQSPWLVLWTVLPPLAGWAFVRLWWIPRIVAGKPSQSAVLAFARYLSGVYLYVYLMILVGAVISAVLALFAPGYAAFVRFCLWYFLFGESFFVPAALWLRMIVWDTEGQVFGPYRRAVLGGYMAAFVLVPIASLLMGVCVGRR